MSVSRDKRDFQGMGEGIVWSRLWGKRRVFEGEGDFCCMSRGWGWLISVFEWECLNFERVFDWERVFELREKRVFEWGIWNCSVYCAYFESYKLDFYVAKFRPPGKFVHISVLTNRAKWVLKARVLIGSRVLETQDASFPLSFKTGQLMKLLAL